MTLSGRVMNWAPLDDLAPVIVGVLDEILAVTGTACELIEFSESGAVARTHVSVRTETASVGRGSPRLQDTSLAERLVHGERVLIPASANIPSEVIARSRWAPIPAQRSLLGLPASIGGAVISALVVEGARWSPPLVERLQLLSEILGAALQRGRHERALSSNRPIIEQFRARLHAENEHPKEIKGHQDFEDIVGESPALQVALNRVGRVAPTNSNVLLLGPTGTGKELFALAVHKRSRRHAQALIRVNCAALPPTLIESELFGHEKGAFTGASGMRQGRFELADGGTIFLDEIGDLTPEVQVKFLRVLQEGEFERVGSSHTRKVDVRVIAATHHDLEAEVARGRFRSDLYYRLSVYPIQLPSLRERAEDIPRLVWFFIHRHQRELGRRIMEVPPSVMTTLQQHLWPGNVRELENVVERAMIGSAGHALQLDAPLTTSQSPAGHPGVSDTLVSLQRTHIEAVLERCNWRINGTGNAADILGLHPNTLRFRLRKLGLQRPTTTSCRPAIR